ncbi:hypothetical protein DL98DRAFT_540257 [Cadophora sp. DSE1049]|nr:hypothetical protein DL98DRAFT_540257 [Cadophora sp. DSE1049]
MSVNYLDSMPWKRVQNLPALVSDDETAADVPNDIQENEDDSSVQVPVLRDCESDETGLSHCESRVTEDGKHWNLDLKPPATICAVTNSMSVPQYRQLLGQENIGYENVLIYDRDSYKTSAAGVYALELSDPNDVHLKLVYEYSDGIKDVEREMSCAAVMILDRTNFSSRWQKAWCLLGETFTMIMDQTLTHDRNSSFHIQDFMDMPPNDVAKATHLGSNRTPSIHKFIGSKKEEQDTTDQYMKELRGLVRAWKSQRPKCILMQNSVTVGTPAPRSKRPTAYIERYRLTLPEEILTNNNLEVGNKVIVTLDFNELGKHPRPFVDEDLRYDEADIAAQLGICVSGKDGETGEEFAQWVTRGETEPWSGTMNHPAVNAAMTIVDWMRGETIVPAPQNRVLLKNGDRRLEDYFGTRTAEERQADHADRERLAREKRRRDDGLQKRDTTWRGDEGEKKADTCRNSWNRRKKRCPQ